MKGWEMGTQGFSVPTEHRLMRRRKGLDTDSLMSKTRPSSAYGFLNLPLDTNLSQEYESRSA